jgi:SecD/SecF fusion protein
VAELDPRQVGEVENALDADFGVARADFVSNSVGPTFGEQIARTAVLAVIASLLLISLYIGFRFEWKFAVPVLIALAHDLLITAGTYAIFGREVTTATVAALLTILGYSLYDTVIVFDRIRENVPRMPRATFSQIANRSMSEVFTRSLATSFVVLMPVGSLLLFGGDTLKDFAFALLVGVISGAYSSIFIATPVLVEWKEREQTYMRRRRLMLQEHAGHIPAFAPGTLGEPAVAAAPAAAAATRAQAPEAAAPAAVSERQARRQRRAAAAGSRTTTTAPKRPAAPPQAPPPERAAEPSAETPASPSAPTSPTTPTAPTPTAPPGDGAKPKPKSKSKRQQKRRKHGRR